MNTNILALRAVYTTEDVDNAKQPLSFLFNLFNDSTPSASESADELLILADGYQATQPSFADDLRAAAESATRH